MDVDLAAAALIDMLDSAEPVLHLQHPRPRPYSEILEIIARSLNLPLVSYSEWLARLETAASQVALGEVAASAQLNAGIRLMEFLRTLLRRTSLDPEGTFDIRMNMASTVSINESKTLQDPHVHQLDASDVQSWVAYWRSSGLLPL